MANQDRSMLENQTPDGDNEIQEAAVAGPGGMDENGSGDDLDLEAKLRLDEDLSSVSSESEDSLEAQYAEIVAAVARHHRESFPKFQADFAKVFGISRETSDEANSEPIESSIDGNQELEGLEVCSNYLAGHHFFFGPAFKSSQHYKLIRRTIRSAKGIPELEMDWSKLLEMEVSHLIGEQEDLINLKSDADDALGKSSVRVYHRDSVIEAVRNGKWNCDNNIIGVLKL